MIIYADIILAVNLLMNSIILWFTARATDSCVSCWRIIMGSGAGAMYVLLGADNSFELAYSAGGKLLVSGALIVVTFGYLSWRMFLFRLGVFYFTSFLFGGAVVGWMYFIESGQWTLDYGNTAISWAYLLGGSLLGAGIITALVKRCISRMYRKGTLHSILIEMGGARISVMALLDTGNGLHTIVGRKPVILVEFTTILPLVSPEAAGFLRSYPPSEWLANINKCPDHEWLGRIEIVPYQTVGSGGMLLAFRTDRISLASEGELSVIRSGVVAVYAGQLTSDSRYQALLHPGVFQNAKQQKEENLCA